MPTVEGSPDDPRAVLAQFAAGKPDEAWYAVH